MVLIENHKMPGSVEKGDKRVINMFAQGSLQMNGRFNGKGPGATRVRREGTGCVCVTNLGYMFEINFNIGSKNAMEWQSSGGNRVVNVNRAMVCLQAVRGIGTCSKFENDFIRNDCISSEFPEQRFVNKLN